ncbi:MAG TPA: DUF4386 family protein [Anaerolineales bacterium]
MMITKNQITDTKIKDTAWRSLYKIGGAAALLVVLTALFEIIITFLPGGYASAETVNDWFALFQNNWFLGLRNLGLLNIIMTALGIPMFFALYAAHRNVYQQYAALAMIISFIGVAVFYATNRAFPMLDLSNQYASATTDAQRAVLSAAGQAMLSIGESHTPGTFIGFFLSEIAGILISFVMLRSKVFSKLNAYFGILGFSLLLIFEVCSSFVPTLSNVVLIFAMSGGLLSMAWYILIARRLFQLASAS